MNPLSGIRQVLRRRYRRWIDRRTRLENECRLDHRRLYILPSKAGFGFLVLVAALWLFYFLVAWRIRRRTNQEVPDLQDVAAYINALEEADCENAESFRILLERGYDLFHLTNKDVAQKFGVNRITVIRWKTGANAPHPTMRAVVFAWLVALAKQEQNK